MSPRVSPSPAGFLFIFFSSQGVAPVSAIAGLAGGGLSGDPCPAQEAPPAQPAPLQPPVQGEGTQDHGGPQAAAGWALFSGSLQGRHLGALF